MHGGALKPGVTVYGIRHHGPGCARSLAAALASQAPDCILIEGPPEADEMIAWAKHPAMVPPVALLVYLPDTPGAAAYYPFAVFSPEWQALSYGATRGITTRFIDLPAGLGLIASTDPEAEATAPDTGRPDPIALLAQAAGYADSDLWWDRQVEARHDATGLFDAILHAMGTLRRELAHPLTAREAQREAHMRLQIRQAQREAFGNIAVVCGAWHAPVLLDHSTSKADQALLKGLPRVKTETAWIPWTYARLATRSGYGAGVQSPGWYDHLWRHPGAHGQNALVHWVVRAARLLRAEQLDASSASVIETVRLAEALAALRGFVVPSLGEIQDALLGVLAAGRPEPLALIRTALEVGSVLGEVPPDAPAVPLQRDLAAQQKRLRLKVSAERQVLELDLRKDLDRERQILFHRLGAIGVMWALQTQTSGQAGAGTFKEVWLLEWRPELALRIIEVARYGNTIDSAASALMVERAATQTLPELTHALAQALDARLAPAAAAIIDAIRTAAALQSDVHIVVSALPPLARLIRYSDVRGTNADLTRPIFEGLLDRALIGLAPACQQLDDDAAEALIDTLAAVESVFGLVPDDARQAAWFILLGTLADNHGGDIGIHGLVRGRATRLLADAQLLDTDALAAAAALALSKVVAPLAAGAWVAGLVRGSGMLLVHQERVLCALDQWLGGLDGDAFTHVLPLLRRAFADFDASIRRRLAEAVGRLAKNASADGSKPAGPDTHAGLDPARVACLIPIIAAMLGVDSTDGV